MKPEQAELLCQTQKGVFLPAMQMRFPSGSASGKPRGVHHMTLLDGEMVVDCDATTGKQTRRFLAYDLMTLNMSSLATRPFKARPSTLPACLHLIALDSNTCSLWELPCSLKAQHYASLCMVLYRPR